MTLCHHPKCPKCGTCLEFNDEGTAGDGPYGRWQTHDFWHTCPECDWQQRCGGSSCELCDSN